MEGVDGMVCRDVCMQAYELNTLLLDNFLTMGVGLPSMTTTYLLHLEKKVMVVCGDGGSMLNSQVGF